MQQIQRFTFGRPSDQDLYAAAITGDWSACNAATEEDLMRLLMGERTSELPPPTAAYMAFEAHRLHEVPNHLLTKDVIASLWDLPEYSAKLRREFELGGELGDWGYLEPLLLTEANACRAVNDRGETCLHIAARHRNLRTIPKQMVTLRAMLLPDCTAVTPMALADEADLEKLRTNLHVHVDD